jgi:hypothetical protein
MGHIGNALGLRLSLNRFWRGSVDNSLVLRESNNWIGAYLDKLFRQDSLRRLDFIFSHFVLQQVGNKLCVNVFVQDAFLQMNEQKCLNMLYPLKRSRRGVNVKRNYSVVEKVQRGKDKNSTLFKLYKEDKKDKKTLLISIVKTRIKVRKLVFRKLDFEVNKNIFIQRRLRLLAIKRAKGFFNYNEQFEKDLALHQMLLKKQKFLRKGRLFIFIRNRFYYLLCLFLKEQLRKILSIPMYSVNISILSVRYMTSEIMLKYMVRRLEQGYFLGSLAKSILKDYMKSNLGIRFKCSGRFTRVQRAQTYIFKRGRTPLNTFNVKFDYNFKNVRLKYGLCGIKLWLARRC